jgi:hypothetical protein
MAKREWYLPSCLASYSLRTDRIVTLVTRHFLGLEDSHNVVPRPEGKILEISRQLQTQERTGTHAT